ncbi:MAG: transcriptional repressor LexA [Ruminococcaceae bacterium]|nr:transcriptional repressor LexA [Oscillospiraceae bacterium]
MKDLKPKEQRVLNFIRESIMLNGYAPSVRDICAALDIKSTSTVHLYLRKLEEKGYIDRCDGKSRAIRVDESTTGGRAENTYKVPILGQVAAGTPILTIENFDGYLDYTTLKKYEKDSLFALKIAGTSMIDAGILDGDYVVVEYRPYADNGDIVVAMVDDSATVKRFFKEKGRYRLQPENSEMEPIIVDEVSILGKVVASLRYY